MLTLRVIQGDHVSFLAPNFFSVKMQLRDTRILKKEMASFIEENHEHKVASRQSQHSQPSHFGGPSQDMMSFWGILLSPVFSFLELVLITISGYKFETLSLIPDTWDATPRDVIENRENEVVNNHAQYCSIVKTSIGKAKLIIGGEVDAGKSFIMNGNPPPLSSLSLLPSPITAQTHHLPSMGL